jgi:hypothetical protein
MLIQVKVAKLGSVEEFEVEALPPASLQYAITYGLTQAINDAHASVSPKGYSDRDAFLRVVGEKVAKRVEQIRSGNVPGTRAPADPKAKAAREVLKAAEEAGVDMAEVMDAIAAIRSKKSKSKH